MCEQPPLRSGTSQEEPAFIFTPQCAARPKRCMRESQEPTALQHRNEREAEILKTHVLHKLGIHSLIAETTKNGLFNRILLVHEELYNYNTISLRRNKLQG